MIKNSTQPILLQKLFELIVAEKFTSAGFIAAILADFLATLWHHLFSISCIVELAGSFFL